MEGKIVFEGKTNKGTEFLIRYPQEGDAKAMMDYINELSKEQTFIRFQGEQLSLAHETKFLNEQLGRIKDKRTVQLHVFSKNKLIGISGIDLKDKIESHEGVFGISLRKEFRGEGMGKTLMRMVLNEAIKNLPQLRIITMGVFEDNPIAMNMYKKFGFKEYGRLPEGIRHRGKYVDHIYIFKKVKN